MIDVDLRMRTVGQTRTPTVQDRRQSFDCPKNVQAERPEGHIFCLAGTQWACEGKYQQPIMNTRTYETVPDVRHHDSAAGDNSALVLVG